MLSLLETAIRSALKVIRGLKAKINGGIYKLGQSVRLTNKVCNQGGLYIVFEVEYL